MEVVAKEAISTKQQEEAVLAVTKRKRTKRHRLRLPLSAPSPTSTSAVSGCTTEEEEDMANCLILLAQGHTTIPTPSPEAELHGNRGNAKEKFTSRRFAEASMGKAGFYVYECKTCNKVFSSFQALGGHRASHKKPKLAPPINNEDGLELSMNSLSRVSSAGTALRTHECSVCGSEFSSGQALGGHMRRHRPAGAAEAPEAKKERSVLSLDLNLPAPSEEELVLGFPFMFSTSGMVDCHY